MSDCYECQTHQAKIDELTARVAELEECLNAANDWVLSAISEVDDAQRALYKAHNEATRCP